MEQIKKQNITSVLREYCDRYESQTRASLTMRGVSPATITQMLNGKWEKISDEISNYTVETAIRGFCLL